MQCGNRIAPEGETSTHLQIMLDCHMDSHINPWPGTTAVPVPRFLNTRATTDLRRCHCLVQSSDRVVAQPMRVTDKSLDVADHTSRSWQTCQIKGDHKDAGLVARLGVRHDTCQGSILTESKASTTSRPPGTGTLSLKI